MNCISVCIIYVTNGNWKISSSSIIIAPKKQNILVYFSTKTYKNWQNTKSVYDLCTENSKTLMKEVKGLKKIKICLFHELKVSMLLRCQLSLTVVYIQCNLNIIAGISVEIEELIPNSLRKNQSNCKRWNNFENYKLGGLKWPHSKNYHKVTLMKRVWY